MTNKPMLRVERELLVDLLDPHSSRCYAKAKDNLRKILYNPPLNNPALESQYDGMTKAQAQSVSDGVDEILHGKPAAQPQCEECKGWGYHENHHEGGGTECGECGGSGNATVAVALDTSALLGLLVSEISVDDRGFYHLSGIHPNNFKRALEASGAKLTSEVKSHKSPVAVVMPERKTKADYSGYIEQFQSEAATLYNEALDDFARLNWVNP